MDLKQELEKLRQVQDIDSEIFQKKLIVDADLPRQIEELRSAFEEKKKITQETEESLKRIQVNKSQKELDLKTKEESIAKVQSQLYQLKTNQEYHAKLNEINSLKADISVIEEEILNFMEEADKVAVDLNKNKSLIKEYEKEFNAQKSELEDKIKNLQADINHLNGKREILAKGIDAKILQKYEYLLEKRSGMALVAVSGGVCGGCYMKVMDEVINQIRQYKEIVTCPLCARMLFVKED